MASISKWVTSWGVMALVRQGRLGLDVPVSLYLTRWQLPPSEFDNDGVTVRRLFTHMAGLIDGLGYLGFAMQQLAGGRRARPRRIRARRGLEILRRQFHAAAPDRRGHA
jgi:CubicO group peptidase (beta-lactamase class C family)